MTGTSVWVASYPKSGNTWLRAMLTALLQDGRVDINDLVPPAMGVTRSGVEAWTGWSVSDLSARELLALRRWADREGTYAHGDAPRIRKTHDAYLSPLDGLPVIDVATTRAAIYVVRDPRDVALSLANHLCTTVERAVEAMADHGFGLPPADLRLSGQLSQHLDTWSGHVESWLDQRDVPVTTVRYEDLHADPVSALVRAAGAAGLTVDTATAERAVSATSFALLSDQERVAGFRERPPGVCGFFRRGTSGQWRTDLPAELVVDVEAAHAATMERLGYVRCSLAIPPTTGDAGR